MTSGDIAQVCEECEDCEDWPPGDIEQWPAESSLEVDAFKMDGSGEAWLAEHLRLDTRCEPVHGDRDFHVFERHDETMMAIVFSLTKGFEPPFGITVYDIGGRGLTAVELAESFVAKTGTAAVPVLRH